MAGGGQFDGGRYEPRVVGSSGAVAIRIHAVNATAAYSDISPAPFVVNQSHRSAHNPAGLAVGPAVAVEILAVGKAAHDAARLHVYNLRGEMVAVGVVNREGKGVHPHRWIGQRHRRPSSCPDGVKQRRMPAENKACRVGTGECGGECERVADIGSGGTTDGNRQIVVHGKDVCRRVAAESIGGNKGNGVHPHDRVV